MRSRFLPVDQLDDETFAPRIVQVCVCVVAMDECNCYERGENKRLTVVLLFSSMCV